ncbi:hypothetical protein jhhlp_008655 [Lomentospora prolificans]|uniref:Enoyl reductase (ER) domain-containing protein n=1 Tax=Lomentospora prolificans TaxID=41688 RepID=A0A2N3MYM7_9PEZI|nr:hypothetical protein jhhlp_008655 [Lomentospora prolificans]
MVLQLASPDPMVGIFYYHQLLAREFHGPRRATLPVPPLLLDGSTKLTLPPVSGNGGDKCSNSGFRHDMWLESPVEATPDEYRDVGFLTHLGLFCAAAKVRDCTSTRCREAFAIMDSAAPPCSWNAFRNWAVVAMACQQTLAQACLERLAEQPRKESFADAVRTSRGHTHLVHAARGCFWVLENSRKRSSQFQPTHDGYPSSVVDLREVCNVIYWMANIQAFRDLGVTSFRRWDHYYLLEEVTLPPIWQATKKVAGLGLCSCRFWNFVNLADRKQSDLPDVIYSLGQGSRRIALHHPHHQACAPTKCQFSHKDSTKVEQLHKCTPGDCEQTKFRVEDLVTALELGEGTSWSRSSLALSAPGDRYIAISHVWSDGTGVGVKGQGVVNSCLFDYFACLAKSLDCNGIWWDAISIPLEPKARARAIGQMHKNYIGAEYTVVHDQYLLNIEFTDPETACLAIVLSPWFTRGWTALELRMSNRVKVLFKGVDSSNPDIKDLEHDILAKDPGSVSRTHWLASSMISRLRTAAIEYVDDILAILRPRSTSWVRDRTVIAGLLTGVRRCDYSRSEGEITRDIITHIGAIPHSALLHGMPTMFETGPFSWCPATLDDMPIDLGVDLDKRKTRDARMLRVSDKGAATGRWYCEPVTARQIKNRRLEPHGDHISVAVYFYNALLHWENCLILRERKGDPNPALLVVTVQVDRDDGLIDCRYVGAVRISEDDREEEKENRGDDSDDDVDKGGSGDSQYFCEVAVRLGNENGHPDRPARDVVADWCQYRDSLRDRPSSTLRPPQNPNKNPDAKPSIQDSSQYRNKKFIERFKKRRKRVENPWYKEPAVKRYSPPREDETEESGNKDDWEPTEMMDQRLPQALQSEGAENLIRLLISGKVDIPSKVEEALSFGDLILFGSTYLENNMLPESEASCRRAIGVLPQARTANEMSTLTDMSVLAKVCWKLKLFNEARHVYGLLIGRCIPEDIQHQGIKFRAIGELCLLLAALNEMSEASERYREMLRMFGNPPDVVYAFAYDGEARMKLPHFQRNELDFEAENIYNKALKVLEKQCGSGHAITAITALNLAAAILGQGDISEAEEMLYGAIRDLEKVVGHDHVLTLRAKFEVARIYILQGRMTEPERMIVLLRECESRLGQQHWLSRLINLTCGAVYEYLERFDEAIPILQRAQEGRAERGSTADIYLAACAKRDLGIVYSRLGKLDEAESECEEALREFEGLPRPETAEEYVTIFCLGAIRDAQAGRDGAEDMFRKSLAGLERLCGPTDPETREVVSKLGRLCRRGVVVKIDDDEEASESSYEHVLRAIYQLSHLLERCGDLEGSKVRVERAFPGYESVFQHEIPSSCPFPVDKGDYAFNSELEDHEILVRNEALAINKVEWSDEKGDPDGEMDDRSIDYSNDDSIMADDVAGVVRRVGAGAGTGFRVGDRVLGHAVYSATGAKKHAGFRRYTVLPSSMASRIPRTLSFEDAVVLPLGVSTAAAALFQQEYLHLPSPARRRGTGNVRDGTLLVMGGTTSAGTNAIQLATAAGFKVIATALPKDFDFVKEFGARQVVDSRSPSLVDGLVNAFGQDQIAGAFDTVGTEYTTGAAIAVLGRVRGRKIVVSVMGNGPPAAALIPGGITSKVLTANAGADIRTDAVSSSIYGEFLPRALEAGKYKVQPGTRVTNGLGSIQAGLEAGKKMVVRL